LIEQFVEPGTVYFVYRSVGDFIGAESKAAAEAAYCAGDQGKFWEMHDTIFANQTGENVGAFERRRLDAFADSISLDRTAYDDCMDSDKYGDLIEQDEKDAETQTRVIQGAQTIDVFTQEIEAALADMGQ
jgi:protein-disulfide isomerase